MFNIAIINYGMGNVGSVLNALEYLKIPAMITCDKKEISNASALILPGVGAFGEAMLNLHSSGLINTLNEQVVKLKKPLLGICLGMQLLFESSEEMGEHIGLGYLEGRISKISIHNNLKLPHVGWNEVDYTPSCRLYQNIPEHSTFYFDHSYAASCPEKYISATCQYGEIITASVAFNNIFGAQFHPEKSQINGLRIIKNFSTLAQELIS